MDKSISFDCLNEIHFDNQGMQLTDRQIDLAVSMARCKLLADPEIMARFENLKSEAIREVMAMVKSTHGLK